MFVEKRAQVTDCSLVVDQVIADLPTCFFETNSGRSWTSRSDGERFVLGVPHDQTSEFPITLILNWTGGVDR